MLRRSSLRVRIVVVATGVVALVLATGGWLLASALRSALTGDVAQAAALRSQDLGALAAEENLPDPIAIGEADEALVQVIVGEKVVAASENVAGMQPLEVPLPPTGTTRVVRVPSLPINDDSDAEEFVVAATSVQVEGRTATVLVASTLEGVTEALAEATRLGLLALPALVLVLAAAIWVLVGRTLAPVDAIRAEADAITGSDLHRRVPRARQWQRDRPIGPHPQPHARTARGRLGATTPVRRRRGPRAAHTACQHPHHHRDGTSLSPPHRLGRGGRRRARGCGTHAAAFRAAAPARAS